MTAIISTATLSPKFKYTQEELTSFFTEHWFNKMPREMARKAKLIFKGSQIDERYSVIPLDTVFTEMSFKEKNDIYIKEVISMGTEVLEKALEKANLDPTDIDGIITTSCTGFMIPSMDAYIINNLKMKNKIFRLPVTEMGCAGGTSALIYAHQYINSNPGKKVAIVSVETPSITMQLDDFSAENLVSSAIFADGASCVILDDSDNGPKIIDTDMYHFPDATYLMGYELRNSGLKIVLDRDVPDAIKEHFPKILPPFLKSNNLEIEDVEHYMFHPGGKKIIKMVEEFITPYGKDISESLNVLAKHGNMSSSTILYILEEKLKKDISSGKGYMLAFGPGFMAQSLLLSWD